MDPATVFAVLGVHLLVSAGLLFGLSRQMPPRSGVGTIAAGSFVFGAVYCARFYQGVRNEGPLDVVFDSAMVLSALLLWGGIARFVGWRVPAMRWMLAATVGYAAVRTTAVAGFGSTGRYVLLPITLGLLYAAIATTARVAAKSGSPMIRPPLLGFQLLLGFLSAITLVRGGIVLAYGTDALFVGPLAQGYYAGASVVAVLMGPNLIWMLFARLNEQLADAATHDALTRTLNRHGLEDVLRRHFGNRQAPSLTLLQVDIDHFKRINDAHGHRAGDEALRAVAAVLMANLRACDFVARTGGEEFLVGLVGESADAARSLGERLRRAVMEAPVARAQNGSVLRCTVSIGISRPFTTLDGRGAAEGEADASMYVAKATGRNRVVPAADEACGVIEGVTAA